MTDTFAVTLWLRKRKPLHLHPRRHQDGILVPTTSRMSSISGQSLLSNGCMDCLSMSHSRSTCSPSNFKATYCKHIFPAPSPFTEKFSTLHPCKSTQTQRWFSNEIPTPFVKLQHFYRFCNSWMWVVVVVGLGVRGSHNFATCVPRMLGLLKMQFSTIV